MNIGELKALIDGLDDSVEVRTMTQYSWPFENSIQGGILASDINENEGEYNEPEYDPETGNEIDPTAYVPKGDGYGSEGPEECFYLTEGKQIGYGTKAAWNC